MTPFFLVDAVGTTRYSYDAAGQLLTEDGPFTSDTVTNTYQNRLRMALGLQQPTGAWTNGFGWDLARRLTNVTSQAGSFGYEYSTGVGSSGFSSALVKRLVLPNLATITNNYDTVARLLGTYLRTSSGALTNSHEYIYNPAGQRTNETRIDGSTVAYSYDHIGQLRVADSSVASEDRGYAYDAAWNLNWLTNSGDWVSFQVNGLNELTNAWFGYLPSTYDANGNLLYRSFEDQSGLYFHYDDENRLVSFTIDESSDYQQFVYDGVGRLRVVNAWDGSYDGNGDPIITVDRVYIYDSWRVIQERDGSNTPTVSYTRGIDLSGSVEGAAGIGGLLARSDGYSSGNWTTNSFYHADGNGNITYMVASNQQMVAKYVYDPFGNTISQSGALAGANLYRFSSKQIFFSGAPYDGIYYYGYRWYDPNLQRWPNRDPIGEAGGVNLYAASHNDFINKADALGFQIVIPLPGRWPPPASPLPYPRPPQPPQPPGRPATYPQHPTVQLPSKPWPSKALCLGLGPIRPEFKEKCNLQYATATECVYFCPGTKQFIRVTRPAYPDFCEEDADIPIEGRF